MIDEFLLIADELASRDTGRPKQASLRRATATAYYAVFHALCELCADELVGRSKPWSAYTPLYRLLDHRAARNILEQARRMGAINPAIEAISVSFTTLQTARIEADYVPSRFRFARQQVKNLIAEAREAVAAIRTLPAPARLELAVLFVTKAR